MGHCFKFFNRNRNKFSNRNRRFRTRKIRNNTKSSSVNFRKCAIKFGKDIGTSFGSLDNYHRSEIAWLGFLIERILDLRITQ